MQSIESWIDESLLDATVDGRIVKVNDVGNFLIIEDKYFIKGFLEDQEVVPSYFEKYEGEKRERLFDDNFTLILDQDEIDLVMDESLDIKYYLFQFGERWYYCDDYENPVLNEFKYLGKAKSELGFSAPFIGIHGGYDLCNGSRLYSDWCKKSKFLGVNTLGLAEENTLAGTLDFQNECKEAGIKSIIGETITVRGEGKVYTLKLYVKSEIGWKSLLRINAEINVHNNGFINEQKLLSYAAGLICVIPPDSLDKIAFEDYKNSFTEIYFQYDLVEWDNADRDLKWLEWIKTYLNDWSDRLAPILITDAYYLDKQDSKIRRILNKIGEVRFKYNSKNQWFKSLDEIFSEMAEVFNADDARLYDLFEQAVDNLNTVCDSIDFKIEVGKLKLPKYIMTEEENAKYNGCSSDMIWDLVSEGFKIKISGKVDNEDIYLERIEKELGVIAQGNLEDYFLILYDIIRFCKQEDIWVGIGRGSAAGSLVSYLINLVGIDPIKYDLIFERFLNFGRVGKSLPDIDTDFEGARRDEVKRYIEQRYGIDYVTSIGTYTTMKLRGAISDLARCSSVPASKTKFVTSFLDPESSFSQLFSLHAKEVQVVKEYIKNNPKVIDNLPLCLGQPKTASIHAAGVVIVPKEYGTIYEQMPVKMMDGILVSEWEGSYIDKAGFLKCDILGIRQLDKFAAISRLIESTTGKKVTFDDIDLEEEIVYNLFKDGFNGDVFQFGTSGLKGYCKKLKPDNIEDLIAAVALYRPGAMDTGGHEKYIKIKNGEEEAKYWYGTNEITKNTYGILVYQEQVMRIVQEVGGFNLVEADDIRKAMGKKDKELLDSYKSKFIDGAIEYGCPEDEAHGLWEEMETFAGYAFNRSHAACYAITGYYSQWYKAHYPLQFWTVALQFAKSEDVIEYISEIEKTLSIRIAPVDINRSEIYFKPDVEKNSIYWSINSVKWVGESAIKDIQEERTANGTFFSLEEFVERTIIYRSINSRVIKNLILSGAFDEIENITDPTERYRLLKWYYDFRKLDFPEDIINCKQWREHLWMMMQISLSGCGFIDFNKIISSSKGFASKQDKYKPITDLLNDDKLDIEYVMTGILLNVIERDSRNGKFAQLEIQDNSDILFVTLWNEAYDPIKSELKNKIGNIIILSGTLRFDRYKNKNCIHSNNKTKIEFV